MRNEIKIYQDLFFGDFRYMIIDGATWFVGIDIAKILGYADTDKALRDHVQKEDKRFKMLDLRGRNGGSNTTNVEISTTTRKRGTGTKRTTLINESGLIDLVLDCRLPWARDFRHWVTSEVIPQILRTGKYEIEWAKARESGKLTRISLTDAIKMSGENERLHGHAYTLYTDLIYKVVFGKTAMQLKRVRGVASDANLRDYLSADELQRVDILEATIVGLLLMGKQYQDIKSVITMPRLLK